MTGFLTIELFGMTNSEKNEWWKCLQGLKPDAFRNANAELKAALMSGLFV